MNTPLSPSWYPPFIHDVERTARPGGSLINMLSSVRYISSWFDVVWNSFIDGSGSDIRNVYSPYQVLFTIKSGKEMTSDLIQVRCIKVKNI